LDKPKQASAFRQLATKEVALLTGFLFFGLVVMPVVIYFVGQTVFGTYGGLGYGDFFGTLSTKVRNGDYVAWFLVLSPYLGWQILRLLAFAWRQTSRIQAAP
jgi:hypothetical protein